MKILIIGAGNMGLTYGAGFIQSHVIKKEDLYYCDKTAAKAEAAEAISAHELFLEPGDFLREMDVIILSVKPQDFASLAVSLVPYIKPDQLVFSIMAGINLTTIRERLGVDKVIRAMPNLPAQIGLGMTVFTTSQEVDKKDLFIAQNLLNTTGKAIHTPNESLLDAATAISGSGPAYVFYFMQAMIERAMDMGFSDYESQLLVEQTFLGAVQLLKRYDITCNEWIQKVASKGGTTEAALNAFSKADLMNGIFEGLDAAKNRSEELSKKG